jgi:tetratricopeptide (TPR) repeat protein
MSRNFKIALVIFAAAALLLAGGYSALERSRRAGEDFLGWRELAALAYKGGPGAASAALEKRLEQHPNDALLHYYRARLYFEEGLAEEALRSADLAIALGYAQEISHLLKALVYGRLKGDYARQRELATKALVYDPAYDHGYLVRAEAGYALGDYSACASDAASFSRLQPGETDGYEYSLLCLERLGDNSGAQAAGLKVLALKPGSHAALWRLGRLHAAQGGHAAAVKRFSEAIRLSGGRPAYYLDRAGACSQLGDLSCAAWDYASATEWTSVSGYASYYLLLGSAMHRIGELDRALEAAGQAARLSPRDPAPLELRARLRAEAGDLAGARRELLAAAELAPGAGAELRARLAGAAGKLPKDKK